MQAVTELRKQEGQNILLCRCQGSGTGKRESSQTISSPSKPRGQPLEHFWLRKKCSRFFPQARNCPLIAQSTISCVCLTGREAKSINQIPCSSLQQMRQISQLREKNKLKLCLGHCIILQEKVFFWLSEKRQLRTYTMNTQSLRLNTETVTLSAIHARQLQTLLGKSPKKFSSAEIFICF